MIKTFTDRKLLDLIKKAEESHNLNFKELVELLRADDCLELLMAAANRTRQKYVGDGVHLRALIEFSNFCKNNCCYCGLRKDNHNLKRYRLDEESIIKLAKHAVNELGFKTIVLQSGEDLWFTRERMCSVISKIKELDVALTLSIGEKDAQDYQAYKEAGCDRFLLRIETTDKKLYERYDPHMSWQSRYQCLKDIKKAGLEVGSGCLVGLPEQSIESLARDILFFKNIDADMIGIGPLIPHPDTPLKDAKGGTFAMAVKVMALTRLLLPDINIPATTAMERLEKDGQLKALQAGANVIMPNITLTQYRQYYELYPNKSQTNAVNDKGLEPIRQRLASIKRFIADDKGFHRRQNI